MDATIDGSLRGLDREKALANGASSANSHSLARQRSNEPRAVQKVE